MKKPDNYDETKAGGEFTPVELGGHKMIIKQVSETKSKSGKDMIVVLFDFAPDDSQPGYFTEMFKNDIRPDKKWPNQATQYILTEDSEGKCNRSFKTFTTCVEHSNKGFTTNFETDNWGAQFKEKKIGGVFGEQMDFYNGKELRKHVMRWFCSIDKVGRSGVPEPTETKAYKDYKSSAQSYYDHAPKTSDGFMDIPNDISDDELPFN